MIFICLCVYVDCTRIQRQLNCQQSAWQGDNMRASDQTVIRQEVGVGQAGLNYRFVREITSR